MIQLTWTVALAFVVAGCTAAVSPVPPPSAASTAATASLVVSSAAPACIRRDTVASVTTAGATPRPSHSGLPAGIPGRLVVYAPGISGQRLTVIERGTARDVPVRMAVVGATSPQVSADGGRISALLRDGPRLFVWSYAVLTGEATTTALDLTVGAEPWAIWTRDARQVAYSPDGSASPTAVFAIGIDARVEPVEFGEQGLSVYAVDWRTNDELAAIVGHDPVTGPLTGAALRSWTRGRGSVELVGNIRSDVASLASSPDGRAIAYRDLAGPSTRRVMRYTDQGTSVVVSTDVVRTLANGCDLTGTTLLTQAGPVWSPDGSRIAMLGRQEPQCCYFLAIASAAGGPPVLFRSPESCYLNGAGGWLDNDRIVMELTGPECGRTTTEGRAIIIDARSGQ
ncbi:MAG: hypothetical protein M3067_00325, partial [Chloroflexota bacterium]|nr:hypothetical protein [Chloroflexota bacterium]